MSVVCVIEDNLPIRKLFSTLLKKSGHEIHEFADGRTALEFVESTKPDGILMDILLPDTNGTDLLKKMRNIPNGQGIPIIAVTGFAQHNDKEKYLQAGFDGYIAKPINTQSFVDEVNNLFNT